MNYELPFGKGRKWLNRGGVINAIFGGFDMVYLYRIQSGDALTFSFGGSPYQYMPGVVAIPRRPSEFHRAARRSARQLAGHRRRPLRAGRRRTA